VVGSYVLASELQMRRPARRGEPAATRPTHVPRTGEESALGAPSRVQH
jgi:hypothetical protein